MLKESCVKMIQLNSQNNRYLQKLKQPKKVFSFLSFVTLLSFLPSVQVSALLSATTIHVINGTEPYLVGENGTIPADLNDVLNFSVTNDKGEKTIYYGNSVLPEGTLTTGFKENMKISDFNIMDVDSFRDDDGDEALSITGFTYSWKDRFGQEVKSDEFLEPCRSPYELEIKANNLELTTKYGIPSSKTYTNLSKKFAIEAQYHTPICYIKPSNMYNYPFTNYDGGYTSDFIPEIGFKAKTFESQGRVWPTTGFAGARFALITRDLDKTNDHYTFSVTKGGDVLSVHNGNEFLFRTNLYEDYELLNRIKPPYQYTIEVKDKDNGETYEYSFEIEKWAVPDEHRNPGRFTFDDTKKNCEGVGGTLFWKEEFTNSYDGLGGYARFRRAVDGTLQGEWGQLSQYEGSKWAFYRQGQKDAGFYWTLSWTQVFADNGAKWSDRKGKDKYLQACKIMAK